jgi:DNA-binding response OmpR family regulator
MKNVVLVVDDSATVRKFVSAALQLEGIKVVTACDGMEALERLPLEPVDLVITDLNMPEMDGFELIRNLRASEAYRHLPVMILSSITDQPEKELGRELGAFAYLEKPFSREQVCAEVRRLLSAEPEPAS